MGISRKQIGWSVESNLLWDILNKISQLTKVISKISSGGVQSVTGNLVDNTDPLNPIVDGVASVTGNVVDNTDPVNPVVTADATIQVSPVTVLTTDFTLVSGLYEATISDVNILATSIVEVIPANASYTVVKNAEFLPQTDSSLGAVKIYCVNLPASDIVVTLNITNP
jgi:hypothetical protein